MMWKSKLVCILAVLAMAGCAVGNGYLDRQQTSEVYQRHAGPEESYVRYTSIRGWQSAGYDGIVVELNGRRHYLLELTGPCDLDLRTSPRIKLVNRHHNQLSSFDSVYVGDQRCSVTAVRKIDMEAVTSDLKKLRDQSSKPAGGEIEVETKPDVAA